MPAAPEYHRDTNRRWVTTTLQCGIVYRATSWNIADRLRGWQCMPTYIRNQDGIAKAFWAIGLKSHFGHAILISQLLLPALKMKKRGEQTEKPRKQNQDADD